MQLVIGKVTKHVKPIAVNFPTETIKLIVGKLALVYYELILLNINFPAQTCKLILTIHLAKL